MSVVRLNFFLYDRVCNSAKHYQLKIAVLRILRQAQDERRKESKCLHIATNHAFKIIIE